MTNGGLLAGVFCSKTVFNNNQRTFSEKDIQVLEIGLGFLSVQRSTNEPNARKNFEKCSTRMRIKWKLHNCPKSK